MHRIYKVGILHEHVAKNPVTHVETRSKSTYRAIIIAPAQTVAILKSLPSPLHYTLVLRCAATALRSSEILALRWADVHWHEGRIQISKRWAKVEDGETKTDVSDGYVPLHSLLAGHLRVWQRQTPHSNETDFVFPSFRAKGKKPLCSSVFVADYLRPAAKKAGVHIEDGQRFGLHNLRHSLSNWLVNKRKSNRKPFRESCVAQKFRRRSICARKKTGSPFREGGAPARSHRSPRELSCPNRFVVRVSGRIFTAAITDKAVAERMTPKIDMEWVIVRPVVLIDKPAKGRYTAGPSARVAPLVPLSFDDCADCLLHAATDEPNWIGKIVNVGS
jgi:hypothetical protein